MVLPANYRGDKLSHVCNIQAHQTFMVQSQSCAIDIYNYFCTSEFYLKMLHGSYVVIVETILIALFVSVVCECALKWN